jgi:hypothetical protein
VKTISTSPYPLAVRRSDHGWEILCAPGPLADLFSQLAPVSEPEAISIEAQTMLVIPLTAELDNAIRQLVNSLINLRYDTGQVQLKLFSDEDI